MPRMSQFSTCGPVFDSDKFAAGFKSSVKLHLEQLPSLRDAILADVVQPLQPLIQSVQLLLQLQRTKT